MDDDELRDFNFSQLYDPDLKRGPDQSWLYRLVYESRKGARRAALEFADAMYWTLRPATFEAFQRRHDPRPIDYRDWFYGKLEQFLNALVYEELEVYGIGLGPVPPRTEEP